MIGKKMTNTKLAAYNREHINLCQLIAMKQKKANPSDPFTYDRVMAHLLNGLCVVSDYEVEFRKEPRKTEQGSEYSIDVPYNMKRM